MALAGFENKTVWRSSHHAQLRLGLAMELNPFYCLHVSSSLFHTTMLRNPAPLRLRIDMSHQSQTEGFWFERAFWNPAPEHKKKAVFRFPFFSFLFPPSITNLIYNDWRLLSHLDYLIAASFGCLLHERMWSWLLDQLVRNTTTTITKLYVA